MKTPEEIAAAIIQRANDGYHDMKKSGYPPFAPAPWDDRRHWSKYIEKVATDVLRDELGAHTR